MREVLCVCAFAARIELKTRVTVLMHWREEQKTSNTGRIALLSLSNGELRVRGDRSRPQESAELLVPGFENVILFPSEDSVELDGRWIGSLSRPVHLIVPDGNWPQARKVVTREKALLGLPRVRLPEGSRSVYALRHSPHSGHLSTLEAIARAIGMLESVEARRELEALLDVMVERSLWSRGKLRLTDCRHPIPHAALGGDSPSPIHGEEEPRSGVGEN